MTSKLKLLSTAIKIFSLDISISKRFCNNQINVNIEKVSDISDSYVSIWRHTIDRILYVKKQEDKIYLNRGVTDKSILIGIEDLDDITNFVLSYGRDYLDDNLLKDYTDDIKIIILDFMDGIYEELINVKP